MEYFYIIRHRNTNKKYAGIRYSKYADPNELLRPDGYSTSSVIINSIIKEEGLEAFVVESIKEFPEGGAYEYESWFLDHNQCAQSAEWYNIHNNHLNYSPEDLKRFKKEYWGDENPFITNKYKQKAKQTWLAKYGVDNPSKAEEVKLKKKNKLATRTDEDKRVTREKTIQTNLEKCGHPSQMYSGSESQKKLVQTINDMYGCDNVMHNPDIKIKHHNAVLDVYKDPSRAADIQNKKSATLIAKYGTVSIAALPEMSDKIKATNNILYGHDYYSQSNEFKERSRKTSMEKYGVDNPSKTKEVKVKVSNTIKEVYGDHPARIMLECPFCSAHHKMNVFSRHAQVCYRDHGHMWVKPSNPDEWRLLFVTT